MKSFISFVITILLILVLAGGVYMWFTGDKVDLPIGGNFQEESSSSNNPQMGDDIFDDFESTQKPNESNPSDTENPPSESEPEDGGNNALPGEPELDIPYNVAQLIVPGFKVQTGAAVYLGPDRDRPEIRYTCDVSSDLVSRIGSNFSIGIMMAPLSYFDQVNKNNYTVIDWITEFEKYGFSYLSSTATEVSPSGSGYITRYVMSNVNYENVNRLFTAVGFIKITTGSTVTYRYSDFYDNGTYRSNARSVAYVASAALNAEAQGLVSHGAEGVKKLNDYIDESVDLANGELKPSYNGSVYHINYDSSVKTMSVGETKSLKVTNTENAVVGTTYISLDSGIASVDANGNVTAKKAGSTTIKVYVAGKLYEIDITVS